MENIKALIEQKVEEHDEVIKEHSGRLDIHDKRIQQLEDSNLQTQLKMSEILKSQMKIELLVLENSNSQSKTLNEFTAKILDSMTSNLKENNKTKNRIKLMNTKEFWSVIIGLVGILSAVVTYLTK